MYLVVPLFHTPLALLSPLSTFMTSSCERTSCIEHRATCKRWTLLQRHKRSAVRSDRNHGIEPPSPVRHVENAGSVAWCPMAIACARSAKGLGQ